MHKIAIDDIYPPSNKKIKKDKFLKIDDKLFEIGIRKGLIEKTEDGYVFIGDYEDLLAFKRKKKVETIDWLD